MNLTRLLRFLTAGAVVAVLCLPATAQVRISEFMASNTHTLTNEDGLYEDWIEIENTSATNVNLLNWSLTDKAGDLNEWRFPSTNLNAGQFLVVFASGKNRRTPGAPLHTNFKLDAAGEYLALVRPDGTIATQFSPKFPAQYPDVSFGVGMQVMTTTLVRTNAALRVWVPTDGVAESNWMQFDFDDQSWRAGTNGVGYETGVIDPLEEGGQVSFSPYLALNLQAMMYSANASAWVRVPFAAPDPSVYDGLRLRIRYDDGFVAYLNGQEIARQNAPDTTGWNSAATARHPDSAAVQLEEFDVSGSRYFLQAGTNVLAVHGLNIDSTNTDFLVQPELSGTSTGSGESGARYFTQPSPGAANGFGSTDLGPIFLAVGHSPPIPADTDTLTVTARVESAFYPVSTVTMKYRVMFNAEVPVAMNDSGTNGDAAAGDGVWTARIPASASSAGQMVRYFLSASDTTNHVSRWPIFPATTNSEQYVGTVIADPSIQSLLPVVHLFVADTNAAETVTGTRASLFYLGELYDNVRISLHGQSSTAWPKKSYNIDFNSDHRFLYRAGGVRQNDIKLLTNYSDKTREHTTLTYEEIAAAGGAAHFAFPVRVQRNAAFHAILDLVEDADENWLARMGRDPNGALYKMYNDMSGDLEENEKKTRRWENDDDLAALIANLSETLPLADRARYAWDTIDLPQTISYLATMSLVSDIDHGHKNYYLYRDSDGTGEWAVMPWDVDLSWGRNWVPGPDGSLQDTLFQTNALDFVCTVNRLYNLMFDYPDFRRMYLRRLRTLIDAVLVAPGAPTNALVLEPRMRELVDLIDPPGIATTDRDAFLDRTKWPTWGDTSLNDPRVEVERTIAVHLAGRREFLFNSGAATLRGEFIPSAQPPNPLLRIAGWDESPASGNQDEEYVEIRNPNGYAVDISGWKLKGGVGFTFRGGTVIPAGGSIYVSPNVRAFRARATGPRGGQGLYVQGPYDGHLNAWGETLSLENDRGALAATTNFIGNPSPAQRYLRVTEIMYNPSPAPAITNDAQQFEYVELKNISTNVTLDLNGVRFTNGIAFNFTGSAVTDLAPGQAVLVVRNTAAFAARYGGGFSIAGQFTGALDNAGENLRLEDAVGEKILEFDYNDKWYPITDGLGFSLVIVDEQAPWDTWGRKASWRPSGQLDGSPGTTDPALPAFAPVVVNEILTHTDPPELDSIELFNPGTSAADIGGWFLTDDILSPKKYRLPDNTTLAGGGYWVIAEDQFNTGTNAFRLSELGESVYLLSGDTDTNLTGYCQGYEFGEAPNGVSFGRYTTSQGDVQFVLESAWTPETNNSYPRVGPLVISEIMYRPPDVRGEDDDLDEFVELENITASDVPLYDPGAWTNTWRLRNAVDFDFPVSATLAAGARLLVVGFDPTNAVQLAAFRARYGIATNVPIFGPWQGKLDNSSETIELKQPGAPEPTGEIPFYMIDKVAYRDAAPWAEGADGVGNSLQRISSTGFGNDPTNWFAAGVTAGRATVPDDAPAVSILSPIDGAITGTSNIVDVTIAVADSDGTIATVCLLDNDVTLAEWTGSPVSPVRFTWTDTWPGFHVLRAVATDDVGATTVSVPVSLTVAAEAVDSDGDGMPDAWEQLNGTDPFVADGTVDADGDGLSNYEEFLAGTNPTNPASVLRIESPIISGTNLAFFFVAVSARSYTVQWRDEIGSGAWQKQGDIFAESEDRAVWVTNAIASDRNRFFRVVTPMQP